MTNAMSEVDAEADDWADIAEDHTELAQADTGVEADVDADADA